MRLPKRIPFKTCANPQARGQNIDRANVNENKMVQTYRDLNCSGASPTHDGRNWELRNIYHHHPESKKRKSSEAKSGSIHPYSRYGNAVKTRKSISTIAIPCPVKAIFEKRAATVEVDSFVSPEEDQLTSLSRRLTPTTLAGMQSGTSKAPL